MSTPRKKAAEPPTEDMLTVDEAAKLLSLTPSMIYRFAAQGKIPHYRFGAKTIRFQRSDLGDWARQHKET